MDINPLIKSFVKKWVLRKKHQVMGLICKRKIILTALLKLISHSLKMKKNKKQQLKILMLTLFKICQWLVKAFNAHLLNLRVRSWWVWRIMKRLIKWLIVLVKSLQKKSKREKIQRNKMLWNIMMKQLCLRFLTKK